MTHSALTNTRRGDVCAPNAGARGFSGIAFDPASVPASGAAAVCGSAAELWQSSTHYSSRKCRRLAVVSVAVIVRCW